jgi:hypothetical protein
MSRAMSAQWNSIRNNLNSYLNTNEAMEAFARAQEADESLRGFRSATVVTELLDANLGSFEARDATVASLVRLAQEGTEQQLAFAILWVGLWRPLCCIYRKRGRYFHSRDELASALSATFHEQVGRFNLAGVNIVTKTLLRNTERDLVRSRLRLLREANRQVDMDVDTALVRYRPMQLRAANQQLAIDVRRALRSIDSGSDRDVAFAAMTHAEPVNEVATKLGISHEAARKRVQRTLAQIREKLEASVGSALAFGC